jgi:hypothetical protein
MSAYLEANLLPLVLSIKTPKTDSYIMIAAGLGHKVSQSSVLIQMGNKLEAFWNQVFTDTRGCNNLIEDSDKIKVNGKNRQLDHVIEVADQIFYMESKCNLNFDTEKKPASNAKVEAVCAALSDTYGQQVTAGYFVPCIRTIPADVKKKYPNFNIYGVEWVMDKINCDLFTVDEFFTFFEQVIGPILEEKIYG